MSQERTPIYDKLAAEWSAMRRRRAMRKMSEVIERINEALSYMTTARHDG